MSGPSVSVVIPTRDRLSLLAQTLQTVLAQSVAVEVIVVDDASTDGTAAWVASHPDARVRTVRHATPRGVAAARNTGIEAARGPWVAFVDDDDLWLPWKLSDQLAAAGADGAQWVFGGALQFADGPRLLQLSPPATRPMERLPWRNTVPGGGSNAIMRRDLLDRVGGFDPEAEIVADWDMWLRLRAVAAPAVVRRTVVAYRVHARNMSADLERMLAGIHLIERRYAHLRGGQPVDWVLFYRWLGYAALRGGHQRLAVRFATEALRAGHPGAAKRLLRALVPAPPRDPVADPADATGWRHRLFGRRVLPWPRGYDRWLLEALSVTPEDVADSRLPV